MPLNNFTADLKKQLDELYRTGTAKGGSSFTELYISQ